MGTLRPTARIPDSLSLIWTDIDTDCPRAPAMVLVDDIMQEIVTDIGFDMDEGLYMYKVESYPESHYT